jgi:hypothetical protein
MALIAISAPVARTLSVAPNRYNFNSVPNSADETSPLAAAATSHLSLPAANRKKVNGRRILCGHRRGQTPAHKHGNARQSAGFVPADGLASAQRVMASRITRWR